MVIEIAHFRLAPGKAAAFFEAMVTAAQFLRTAEGYRGHVVGRGVEAPDTASLIVAWRSHADHVDGFEPSEGHDRFLAALEGLYEGEIGVAHIEAGDAAPACIAAGSSE
ncbi:antibiotic biosynthesis monooxygenase family protein [Albimonas pacifica]|uniref:Heme-degrading monooxygenase HmoA n=1 Tax=Albimonas pacifica TaxID=1114924 RepID=A0A1I3IZQ7_9RHOB|nr:antibiotic biosynthesis monooxygenase [Albimonas pacifica]SFI53248.1 Heme-degrading monooxygenase HmoA [Albimonas pacifica]